METILKAMSDYNPKEYSLSHEWLVERILNSAKSTLLNEYLVEPRVTCGNNTQHKCLQAQTILKELAKSD